MSRLSALASSLETIRERLAREFMEGLVGVEGSLRCRGPGVSGGPKLAKEYYGATGCC